MLQPDHMVSNLSLARIFHEAFSYVFIGVIGSGVSEKIVKNWRGAICTFSQSSSNTYPQRVWRVF